MRLKSLKGSNLLSYKDVSISYDSGLYLIQGFNFDENTANGSGKSAVIDILCWSLYGETPRGIKADEIIRWGADGHGQSTVIFEKHNHIHEIHRSRKPNDLKYTIDDQIVVSKDAKELQTIITKNIGVSLETFYRSTYFAQGTSTADEFLFTNDSTKKEVLTELLELNVFDLCLDHSKLLLKEHSTVLSNLKNSLASKAQIMQVLFKNRDQYQVLSSNFETNRKAELSSLTAKHNELTCSLAKAKVTLSEIKDPIQTIEDNKLRHNKIITGLKTVDESLTVLRRCGSELSRALGTIEAKKNAAYNSIKQIENIGPHCEKCGQKISEKHKSDQMSVFFVEIERLDQEAFDIQSQLESVEAEEKVISEKSIKLNNLLISLLRESDTLRAEFERATHRAEMEFDSITKQLMEKENQITTLQQKTNEYEKMLDAVVIELSSVETSVVAEKIRLMECEKLVLLHEQLVEVFGRNGVKAFVFNGIIRELSKYVNDYLEQLFVGDVKLDFHINEKSQSIDTKFIFNGRETNLSSLSGGQRRRLVLATNFALAKLVANRINGIPNFICLDECFDGLDATGKEKILEFLKTLSLNKDFIWVIDHSCEIQTGFDKIYNIEYRNGVSEFHG